MLLSFTPLAAGGAVSNSQAARGPGEPVRQARELSEGVLSRDILLQETDALN